MAHSSQRVEPPQNSGRFKQTSVGGGVSLCIPPICYGQTAAVNVNAAQAKVGSNYASVARQSGVRAGNKGFEVNVKGNTMLTGGAITKQCMSQATGAGMTSMRHPERLL